MPDRLTQDEREAIERALMGKKNVKKIPPGRHSVFDSVGTWRKPKVLRVEDAHWNPEGKMDANPRNHEPPPTPDTPRSRERMIVTRLELGDSPSRISFDFMTTKEKIDEIARKHGIKIKGKRGGAWR